MDQGVEEATGADTHLLKYITTCQGNEDITQSPQTLFIHELVFYMFPIDL